MTFDSWPTIASCGLPIWSHTADRLFQLIVSIAVLAMISRRQCRSALLWLHWPTNFDSYCAYPEIPGEKRANSDRVGDGWVGNSGSEWLSCCPSFTRLLAEGCSFFVPKWVWPRCGRSFRPVALCLAEIEPFYWLQTAAIL